MISFGIVDIVGPQRREHLEVGGVVVGKPCGRLHLLDLQAHPERRPHLLQRCRLGDVVRVTGDGVQGDFEAMRPVGLGEQCLGLVQVIRDRAGRCRRTAAWTSA